MNTVDEVLATLREHRDQSVLADMGPRYGIHTDQALGVPMRHMKQVAKPLGTDHELALALWDSGWYEARVVACLVDDPAQVTAEQMDTWCADFDNWAICDTVCFNLFDRTAHAWDKVHQWADRDEEMIKRGAFALLWGLALHDRASDDGQFADALPLVEREAVDDRHLVNKAVTMALRAVASKRPGLAAEVEALAERLVASDAAPARKVGRPAIKELEKQRR